MYKQNTELCLKKKLSIKQAETKENIENSTYMKHDIVLRKKIFHLNFVEDAVGNIAFKKGFLRTC